MAGTLDPNSACMSIVCAFAELAAKQIVCGPEGAGAVRLLLQPVGQRTPRCMPNLPAGRSLGLGSRFLLHLQFYASWRPVQRLVRGGASLLPPHAAAAQGRPAPWPPRQLVSFSSYTDHFSEDRQKCAGVMPDVGRGKEQPSSSSAS